MRPTTETNTISLGVKATKRNCPIKERKNSHKKKILSTVERDSLEINNERQEEKSHWEQFNKYLILRGGKRKSCAATDNLIKVVPHLLCNRRVWGKIGWPAERGEIAHCRHSLQPE